MARILFLNPNSNIACGDGIAAAIARFRTLHGPTLDVISLQDGPPAIVSWRDWHAAVEPLCRAVARERADLYVVACASDPGIDAMQAETSAPVLGAFRAAVAVAITAASSFGVIALAEASKGRHLLALRAMGVETRLAAEIAMNLPITTLLDPEFAREALITAARVLAEQGAGAIILGCTGMAHHRHAIELACGLPVIDPCQAAAGIGLARV
jgi:Asp/Glu/hydantoin racemase